MSDQHLSKGSSFPRDSAPLRPGNLMTPQATAIAALAFAVFSMMGQGSWSTALSALFWGASFGAGSVPGVMVAWGIGCLVMAGLSVLLAHSTLRITDRAWEAQLARAAVIVAGVGTVLAVVTIIGALVHGT